MLSLAKLVRDARREGWVSVEGRIDSVPYQASLLGWDVIPSRKSGPERDVLKPTKSQGSKAVSKCEIRIRRSAAPYRWLTPQGATRHRPAVSRGSEQSANDAVAIPGFGHSGRDLA